MWSAYLDTNRVRVVGTRLLGIGSRRAYFNPLAPLRTRTINKISLPGKRWVRVRNIVAGISDADIALVYLHGDPRVALSALPRSPRIYLGTEVVGEVIHVGPEADFIRVGDRVAYHLDRCCVTADIEPVCRHCAAGHYALCENRYVSGPKPIGGGWSDEMIVHERQLFLVPDNLSDEQAVLLQPTATSLHTVLRHPPQPGDHVLVIGSHTAGLLTIQAARTLAPNVEITVLADYPFQIEMATRMGATHILYREEGTAGAARITGAHHLRRRLGPDALIGGFDTVYDTIGTPAALQRALRWTRSGGTVVLAGAHASPMQLDFTAPWHDEVSIVGSTGYGTERWPGGDGVAAWRGDSGGRVESFALAAELIREGRLTPHRLVTHRFPLREVRTAIASAHDNVEHRAVKVLLDIQAPAETRPGVSQPRAQRVFG